MTQEELLRRIERAREKVLMAIEGLTEEEMTQELVNREWTVKDILGHITSWVVEDRKIAERIAIEENPIFHYVISSENDWRDWNEQQVEKKRGYSLERIIDELREEHMKFKEFVHSLTQGQLPRKGVCPWQEESSVEKLIQVTYEHDEEHAEKILAWRKKTKN